MVRDGSWKFAAVERPVYDSIPHCSSHLNVFDAHAHVFLTFFKTKHCIWPLERYSHCSVVSLRICPLFKRMRPFTLVTCSHFYRVFSVLRWASARLSAYQYIILTKVDML